MAHLAQSEALKLKIRIAERHLADALTRFRNHHRFEHVFADFLFCLHCSVRASVPLIESALQSCYKRANDCAVAAILIPYYAEHIQEEMHHDEWLLDDMTHLGMCRDDVLARIPSPDVAAMIGAQYYWINHVHPVALLSYLAVVEGNPVTVEALDDIVSTTTIPRQALRTFYAHARLDIGHGAEIWQLLDTLPLPPRYVALLGVNAMLVVSHLARIIDNVLGTAGVPE